MKFRQALVFVLIVWSSVAIAEDDNIYNEITIRPSDIPRDAPRFEDFPAELYTGKNAKLNAESDPATRAFRTRIKEWSKEKPNFAGHFILATWGCGSDCIQLTIIDAVTGRVFHPAQASSNVAANVDQALLEGGDFGHNFGALKFSADSKLLVLIGMPNEDASRRGISYYVWNGARLSLIRFVHKAWYADEK